MNAPYSKKKNAFKKEEYCTFIIRVLDWELPYLFSISFDKKKQPPAFYEEYLHMYIKGVICEPKSQAKKEIDVTFIGDRKIIQQMMNKEGTGNSASLGSITIRGGECNFIGSLPYDSLPIIASLLSMKKLQYFHLHGPSPYRGNAQIKSIYFFRDYHPEDY